MALCRVYKISSNDIRSLHFLLQPSTATVFYKLMCLCFCQIMPVIIFFSTFISVLYYLGVMQFIIRHLAAVMQVTMGTTAAESMNAASNIFVGFVMRLNLSG